MKLRSLFGRRPRIFISYRRDDGEAHTDILYERLVRHFGRKQVFVDVDNIPIGKDFVEVITAAVNACDILLAVIGKQWLTISDGQQRRLDNPEDFVRLEIAAALRSGIPVSPVLVQDASVPTSEQLPDELKPLARRNAFHLSRTHRREDLERLIKEVERVLAASPRRSGSGLLIDKRVWVAVALAAICVTSLVFFLVYPRSSPNVANSATLDLPSPTPNATLSTQEVATTPEPKPSLAVNPASAYAAASPRPTATAKAIATATPTQTPTPRPSATRPKLELAGSGNVHIPAASPPSRTPGELKITLALDIDPTTGLRAVASCPVKRTKVFVAGTEPTKYCGPEYHKRPQ